MLFDEERVREIAHRNAWVHRWQSLLDALAHRATRASIARETKAAVVAHKRYTAAVMRLNLALIRARCINLRSTPTEIDAADRLAPTPNWTRTGT